MPNQLYPSLDQQPQGQPMPPQMPPQGQPQPQPQVTVNHSMFQPNTPLGQVESGAKNVVGKTYHSIKDFLANELQHSGKLAYAGGRDAVEGLDLKKIGQNLYANQDKVLGAIEPMMANAQDGGVNTYRPLPVPAQYHKTLEDAYKENPGLPGGVLEATIMQESHFGQTPPADRKSYEGNYGWMVGFKKSTADDIRRQLKEYPGDTRYSAAKFLDFSTPDSAIKSAANWLGFKQKIWSVEDSSGPKVAGTISNPVDLYMNRYFAPGQDANPDVVNQAKSNIQYYSDAYGKLHK